MPSPTAAHVLRSPTPTLHGRPNPRQMGKNSQADRRRIARRYGLEGSVAGNVRAARIWIWVAVLLVVIAVAFVGVARATDSSSFCPRCHEMVPYYDAWTQGPHAEDAQCVDCHVNPGFGARLAHKFVALQEVQAHFFGNKSFPTETPPNVPNRRCERCHPSVTVDRKNFSHELHASKGDCQDCHPDAGHSVTSDALKAAGIFNPNASPQAFGLKVAVVNGGSANLPGHVPVVCSNCHNMKATGCRACHGPPHKERGECSQCHQPGTKFAFVHPSADVDCTQCHKVSDDHPPVANGKPCIQCHQPKGSFNFQHPAQGADCSQCHQVPAGHPASAATQCPQCHRQPGVSWAFNHRGNTGEHSWRSFPCAKCHPNGYSQASCTCHGGRAPSED